MIENLQEIQEYFTANAENEEVKNYINGFKTLDIDGVKNFLESHEEGKSYFDSKVGKSIETYRINTLPKLVEAGVNTEMLKRNPKLTPEQLEVENIRKELESMKKEKARAEMTSKYKDVMNEKKIPSNLTNFLLSDDEDTVNANISLFEESMKGYIDNMVEERIKQNSYTPPKNEGKLDNNDNLSPIDLLKNAYSKK